VQGLDISADGKCIYLNPTGGLSSHIPSALP